MKRSQKKPVANKPLDPDWQSTRHTPVDRAQHLFQTGLFSDLKFLVGDNREVIKAHKTFLAMTSPVFETMFFGNVPQPQPIIIPDMQASTFKDLLQYIYTNTVKFESVNHANWLYYAADKYMIPNLSDRCIRYVTDNLSPANVFRALEFAILRENDPLKDKCLLMISEKMRESYRADIESFEEIAESTLLKIVQTENLDIGELELFRAVMGWAAQQCRKKNVEISGLNMRQELNKVIGHIRFLAMTPEEFGSSAVRSGILTESECLAVFMNFNSRENWPMPSPLSTNKNIRRSGYYVYTYEGSYKRQNDGWPQSW